MIIRPEMSGCAGTILRLIYLWCFMFCLLVLLALAGCSKNMTEKSPHSTKTWSCSEEADRATSMKDYQTGIVLHERVLENDPNNALALYHLGYAYGQIGDHSKERSHYEKAIALGYSTEHIYYNLGMAYGELSELEKSIWAFKKALEFNPVSSDSHFGLAMAYYQKGFQDKLAEEEFLKVVDIDPTYLDARLYLSIIYADRGETQKACNQLREILKIDPTNTRVRGLLERIEKE